MKELILGGVRSGKSRYAEMRARATGLEVIYVATAQADDDEMRKRIELHRERRAASWRTVEEPLKLAEVLCSHASDNRCLLVDCLTLWLTNLLCSHDASQLPAQTSALLETLPALPGVVVMVSNETNLGVVAADSLTRRYCDAAGGLHQSIAAHCDRVAFIVAGLPFVLKDGSRE